MVHQIRRLEKSLQWTFLTKDVKNKGVWIYSDFLSTKQIPNWRLYILAGYFSKVSDELVIIVRTTIDELVELISIDVSGESGCSKLHPFEKNKVTGYPEFHCPSTFLNGSSFTVTCNIIYFQTSLNLYNNVKPFLLNPSLSDFTIVIGEEELPVHKFILGAQSSVFLAMFESDMKESKENKVTIEDISSDVMKDVLSFLYTGSEEALNDLHMAMDMWIVAEKYNIEELRDLCEANLFELITESNVFEIFEFAVDHELQELRSACLKFIEDNKEKIADGPHFKPSFFEKPQLMYTLFYDRLMNKKK